MTIILYATATAGKAPCRPTVHAVDRDGHPVALPRHFVEGHRRDGSPKCSHGWGPHR